jgi:hypothetical protein
MDPLAQVVENIGRTEDLLERALKLAGVVTRIFRDAGWELVVVGGSAVEFYTEGAYMSGDIDLCRRSPLPIPLRQAQDLMARLGATGGPRSWKVGGMFVDLLGFLENEAVTPCRTVETPCGPISIVPAELAVVERALLAHYPSPDPEARAVAKKMLAACVTGQTPVAWDEVERLARLPAFNIAGELDALRKEVVRELGRDAQD